MTRARRAISSHVASRAGAVNMKVGLVYSTTTGNTETVRRAAAPSCWLFCAAPLERCL